MSNMLDLTKILIDKKLITRGTNISARISLSGFGYAPINVEKEGRVNSIDETGLRVIFDDKQRHTKFEDITSIEGMDISRFAQAYKVKVKNKKK